MSDDALIEAMAIAAVKAIHEAKDDDTVHDARLLSMKAALAVVRPIIEAPLRAENEKLRAALKPFVEEAAGCDYYNLSDNRMWDVPAAMIRSAADALKGDGNE